MTNREFSVYLPEYFIFYIRYKPIYKILYTYLKYADSIHTNKARCPRLTEKPIIS